MDLIELILLGVAQLCYTLSCNPTGTYTDVQKTTTFEFKDGKVRVHLTNTGAEPLTCSTRWGDVTVRSASGKRKFVFDPEADCFTGPGGLKLTKVPAAA